MNKLTIRIMTACALMALVSFSACDDPEQSAEEKFMEQLTGNWAASEITLDEVVIENAFEGFELSITADKKFTTRNGNDPIWPASGSFTLTPTNGTPEFDLERADGVEVEVKSLSDNSLVLGFRYVSTGGRSGSVTGEYEFSLIR